MLPAHLLYRLVLRELSAQLLPSLHSRLELLASSQMTATASARARSTRTGLQGLVLALGYLSARGESVGHVERRGRD
jgi:hypothetical protein